LEFSSQTRQGTLIHDRNEYQYKNLQFRIQGGAERKYCTKVIHLNNRITKRFAAQFGYRNCR